MRALAQFLKFTTKDVVHFKALRDFPCDIAIIGSASVLIALLDEDDVSVGGGEEFDNCTKL
jgi:hypothetical protein